MAVSSRVSGDGATVIINISGRFDFSSHQDFRKAYESLSQPNIGYVIDMSNAEYLDSSALGMLLLMTVPDISGPTQMLAAFEEHYLY